MLPGRDREARHMPEQRRDTVAMIDHDRAAVSAPEVREFDDTIRRRDDRLAVVAADVHSPVERALTVERIAAFAESAHDAPGDRPD